MKTQNTFSRTQGAAQVKQYSNQKIIQAAIVFLTVLVLALASTLAFSQTAVEAETSSDTEAASKVRPDRLIKTLTTDIMTQVKADKELQEGDSSRIAQLVDDIILPHLNFKAMTQQAVGRNWREASEEQQSELQTEFKTLLMRTYSGAIKHAKDKEIKVKRLRAAKEDKVVVVKTLVVGGDQPIEINYRMEDEGNAWKVHDMSVANAWLIEAYRADFAQTIKDNGLDGLIAKLKERNASNSK